VKATKGQAAAAVNFLKNAHLDDSPSGGSDDTHQERSEPELEASAFSDPKIEFQHQELLDSGRLKI
jgi:hypothetical protein